MPQARSVLPNAVGSCWARRITAACDNARIVLVGQRMMAVIAGYGEDAQAVAAASKRFAEFFVATSTADNDGEITVRCGAVSAEFTRLERHTRTMRPVLRQCRCRAKRPAGIRFTGGSL